MPVNKKNNKKNLPLEKQKNTLVPKKESGKKPLKIEKTEQKILNSRINALSTAGKKKKPK